MTKRIIYHVAPGADSWEILREGAKRPALVAATQVKAVAAAKKLARKAVLGQVKLHGRNGRIENEWTYGRDPRRYES